MSGRNRMASDIAFFERFHSGFLQDLTPAQARRKTAMKESGIWQVLEDRRQGLLAVASAEYEYREMTGCPSKADRDERARLLALIADNTDADGELYGHRG